jgi:hypothetical protein
MYAWFPAKAKVNRRGRGNGAVVRVTAAQAVQAQGQECGGLRAPLWRRHARRVVQVGRSQWVPAGLSNRRAVSQRPHVAVSQRDVNSDDRRTLAVESLYWAQSPACDGLIRPRPKGRSQKKRRIPRSWGLEAHFLRGCARLWGREKTPHPPDSHLLPPSLLGALAAVSGHPAGDCRPGCAARDH